MDDPNAPPTASQVTTSRLEKRVAELEQWRKETIERSLAAGEAEVAGYKASRARICPVPESLTNSLSHLLSISRGEHPNAVTAFNPFGVDRPLP